MQINANLIEMTKKIRRKFTIHPTIKKPSLYFSNRDVKIISIPLSQTFRGDGTKSGESVGGEGVTLV